MGAAGAAPRVAQQQGHSALPPPPPAQGRWTVVAGSWCHAGSSGLVSLKKPGFFSACQTPMEMPQMQKGWDMGPETKLCLCAHLCSHGGNWLRSLVSHFDLEIYLFLNIDSLWRHSSSPTTFTLPNP